MTMAMPRPSVASNRPAYLDNLFRDRPNTSSVHSTLSSISTSSTASSFDLRSAYHASRPLSPPLEEDKSDTFSIQSKKSFLSRRAFRLGTVLYRRTYPQVDDMDLERRPSTSKSPSSPSAMPPTSSVSVTAVPSDRRPSLPRLLTSFPPPEAISTYAKKPLPAVPGTPISTPTAKQARPHLTRQKSNSSGAELSCQRCYYYAARNCRGWVMGGEDGDACELCLQSGYFGAK